MKKIFFLMALVLGSLSANAQITSGETTAKVIRTGNRAEKGNFGIYLGGTTDMFKNIAKSNIKFNALPLINLKYMLTDKTELRLGFEMWEKDSVNTSDNSTRNKASESQYTFYPGIAYHFCNKNLLDVYVGGEIPFGWGTNKIAAAGENQAGPFATTYNYSRDLSFFRAGVGAFIGLQCYLGNLPVAIGCEYGVQAMYSHCYNGTLNQDNYTMPLDSYKYKTGNSKFKVGHQIRLTASYYFNL